MMSKSLAIDLKPKNIIVGLLHPGYVATDMTSNKGTIGTEESVSKMIRVIEGMDLEASGGFFHYEGSRLPW